MFVGNDDLISSNHLKTYLRTIDGTDLDFVYVNYMLHGKLARTKMQFERIGHGALIIRTAFAKAMPPHTPNHHHDWELIQNMVKGGQNLKRSGSSRPYMYWAIMPKEKIRKDLTK